jgi:hypothetical protein
MATFYTKGKVDLTILVDDFGNAKVTKKMFVEYVQFATWFYSCLQR